MSIAFWGFVLHLQCSFGDTLAFVVVVEINNDENLILGVQPFSEVTLAAVGLVLVPFIF